MRIAFLGAGMMGRPMVENLLDDGDSVAVWNRTAARARPLQERGAELASSPAAACAGADLVLSCLADDGAARAVCETPGTVRSIADGAGVHVSMSTISPACARELAARHEQGGAGYVAAPILGRPDLVAARRQGHLLSGGPEPKEATRPVLERLGREGAGVFDFGDRPEAAHVAKIAFNLLIASALEAMAEAFSLLEVAGLDPEPFHETATGTLFGCPLYEGYGRQILERCWEEPLFKLELGLKDVRLADRTADENGARLRLAELLEERFEDAVDSGRGSMDWTAIAAEVREEAGLSA